VVNDLNIGLLQLSLDFLSIICFFKQLLNQIYLKWLREIWSSRKLLRIGFKKDCLIRCMVYIQTATDLLGFTMHRIILKICALILDYETFSCLVEKTLLKSSVCKMTSMNPWF
jgi:hypothetical protein